MRTSSRGLLAGVSVAAVVALALTGCTDSAPGGGKSAAIFTTIDENQAIDVNAPINPYNSKANEFSGYNEEQLAWSKNSLTDPNDMLPGLAKSWKLSSDGTRLTVTLQPKAKWSDGTSITAKDIKASVGLGISQGNAPLVVKTINDSTVELDEPAGATSNSFVHSALTIDIVPNSFWGSKIPASLWKDAATASDPKASKTAQSTAAAAIAALGKKLAPIGPKKDISAGPFTLTRVNPGEAVLTKNKYFFAADKIDPSQVVLKSYSGNQQIWSYLKGAKLDAAPYTSTPPDVLKSILAVKGNMTVSGLSQVSAALAFNQKIAPFDNVHVRRGLAYAIDRATVTKVGEGTSGKVSGPTSGLIQAASKVFLGGAAGDLNAYNVDKSKMVEEFTAAGLKQVNGKWMRADGTPFTVNIQVPNGFSDWVAGGKSITSQLSSLGVTSQLETSADYPTYLKDLADGKFAVGFWLVALGPGPYSAYQRVYGSANGWSPAGANVLHSAAGSNGNWMGSPESEQLDGASIDPGRLAASLAEVSGAKQKAVVSKLAKLTNDQLPIIQLWDYINLQFINTTRFTHYPATNAGILANSPGVWMQYGYVKAAK